MKSLNDEDLTSLLRQAKATPPKPSPGLVPRVMQAYEAQFGTVPAWRRFFFGSVRVPILVAISASVILLVTGALLGLAISRSQVVTERRSIADILDGDQPVLNLYGMQPVPELRLRVIRRAK